jgi:hypothetical protein
MGSLGYDTLFQTSLYTAGHQRRPYDSPQPGECASLAFTVLCRTPPNNGRNRTAVSLKRATRSRTITINIGSFRAPTSNASPHASARRRRRSRSGATNRWVYDPLHTNRPRRFRFSSAGAVPLTLTNVQIAGRNPPLIHTSS